ncbi:MAG: glycerophosphodiester phosphodiesterase family protein, partial [Anaerolineae bacterium]|nr:glycerophosphodiester phosphodiesterase family protein [Anaerolineae bacterium]
VQMTKDGVLVVIHDEEVDRTTNGSGLVADLTLAEIQALDAGEGERVPTFAEVIDLAKSAGVDIIPEAKSPHLYPGIEISMVDAVLSAGYAEHTIIQSFNADTLNNFHEVNPDIQLCMLYGLWSFNNKGPQPGQAAVICPMAEMVLLNPSMIRQAHKSGHQVYIWFGALEKPWLMRLMLALGADGIMVDDHRSLAEVLGR